MTRISYLNGQFIPHDQASISIEDRGLQFADGVYEVILCCNGNLIDADLHIERLFASLSAIRLANFKKTAAEIKNTILELCQQNHLATASVYLQVTRGITSRIISLPNDLEPTFIITVTATEIKKELTTITAMSAPDMRWHYCYIKSTGLLASSMAKQQALDNGFDDAVLIRDGYITESTFANVFMVDSQDRLITPPADGKILAGVTRYRLIDLAKNLGIKVVERQFSLEELLNAKEVFLTSTTMLIRPITKIDNQILPAITPNSIASKLVSAYYEFAQVASY